MSIRKPRVVFVSGQVLPPVIAGEIPPIDSPAWDGPAEAIGEALLHERAQFPPVVLGRCEEPIFVLHPGQIGAIERCPGTGFLTKSAPSALGAAWFEQAKAASFLCPRHGADLPRAVRRWPR